MNTRASPSARAPGTPAITAAQASRFLAQASMGATTQQIEHVQRIGYAAWLDEQMAMPRDRPRWDWLLERGFAAVEHRNRQTGFDAVAWRQLIAAPDTLRQRVTLALSEILVVSIDGVRTAWRQFAAAQWLDLLETHAFGSLRALLGDASRNLTMGIYLSFRGNAKANPRTGALPDENYARELMQLFTIGLLALRPDGQPHGGDAPPRETYGPDDIAGLARVFTGWEADAPPGRPDAPDFHRRPMALRPARHEYGESRFLGLTIPAGTDAAVALDMALDHLFAHPNVGPFWSRQLIQRLVSSNPSPAYVQRVAAVFADDGHGRRGNLGAVVRAILLDADARADPRPDQPHVGKLREPILRFVGWARAFGATSPSDTWGIGNTGDAGTRLGQSPLRSPSVFNFFRPGYVPPGSAIGNASLVAPEFQITHESSVIGYLNWMQVTIARGRGDLHADLTPWLPLANDAQALTAALALLLAADQLSVPTRQTIADAVASMPATTDEQRQARVQAATMLVMAAPEFLVLK